MQNTTDYQANLHNVWLYRTVFFSPWRWCLGTVLLGVLFLQPLHQVFADVDSDSATTSEVLTDEDVTDNSQPEVSQDDLVEEEAGNEEDYQSAQSNTEEIVSVESDGEVASTTIDEDLSASTTETGEELPESINNETETQSDEEGSASTTVGDSTGEGVASSTPSQDSGASASTEESAEEGQGTSSTTNQSGNLGGSSTESRTDTSSNTEAVNTEESLESDTASSTEVETVVVEHIQSSNRFQFSEDQCVSVGNGAYHCTDATTGAATDNDVVFTQVNDQGFTDILLRTARETITLTDGQADAGAPYYDPVSETVVWHQSVSGRYQIFAYDIRSRETVQLTATRESNMQPVRSGQRTVWQQWHNDYWQVAIYDGATVELLTDTQAHNVAPAINGNFIIWQTTSLQGVRQVAVYDLDTDLISYIDDSEGGRITNPRFVLVYDAQLPNGDMIVRGFDPETGGVVPFGSVPAVPLPDIPTPDPVGEPRALPANKYESESGDIVELSGETGSSTASSTDDIDTDLDLQTSSSTESFELTEYDVVVTPYVASTSESVASSSTAHTNDGESGE